MRHLGWDQFRGIGRRLLSAPPNGPLPARWVILLGLFFGCFVGLLEAAPLAVAQRIVGIPLRMSPHLVWMTPVADMLLFGLLGLVLVGGGTLWHRLRSQGVVLGSFIGLGALALLLLVEAVHDAAALALALGIGIQFARMARGRLGRILLLAVPAATPLALISIGGLATWSLLRERASELDQLQGLPVAAAGAPNILLLILDTVRAQSLSLHGRTRQTSPNLEEFARSGVTFDWAVAPAPWTNPSHASMFTGRWPHELSADWLMPLDDRHPTLAETLASEGYATAGFVGNVLYASRESGLARGFARYQDYPISLGQIILSSSVGRALAYNTRFRRMVGHHELLNRKPAHEVNENLLDWLEAMKQDDRPWFAFVNYYDAHEPHFPADSVLQGKRWNRYSHRGGITVGGNSWLDEKSRMDLWDALTHASAYEDAVERVDHALGVLLEELEDRGELDNTLVIIASDHGEQLGEHGLFGHNNSLFMTTLHVPLLIAWPGRIPAGERVSQTVSLRDLPATILELIAARHRLPGTSLVGTWTAASRVTPSPAVSYLTRTPYPQPGTPLGSGLEMHSIVEVPWHYIHNGDGTDEIYDLGRDPHEGQSLAGIGPTDSVLVELRSVVFEMMTGAEPPPDLPIKPSRAGRPRG